MNNQLTPARDGALDDSLQTVARGIALFSEGLIEPHELLALANIDSNDIPNLLTSAKLLAAVRRATLQLKVTGDGAHLEAARHAREAVQIAADLMRNADLHASTRLAAVESIHKAAGTHRPKTDSIAQEGFRVIINLGDGRPPVVIGGSSTNDTHGEEHASFT
jgi:hypothetical protein